MWYVPVWYILLQAYVLLAMCTVPPVARACSVRDVYSSPAARLCTARRTFTPVHGYGLRGHVLLAMCTVRPASRVCNACDVYGTSCCEVMYVLAMCTVRLAVRSCMYRYC